MLNFVGCTIYFQLMPDINTACPRARRSQPGSLHFTGCCADVLPRSSRTTKCAYVFPAIGLCLPICKLKLSTIAIALTYGNINKAFFSARKYQRSSCPSTICCTIIAFSRSRSATQRPHTPPTTSSCPARGTLSLFITMTYANTSTDFLSTRRRQPGPRFSAVSLVHPVPKSGCPNQSAYSSQATRVSKLQNKIQTETRIKASYPHKSPALHLLPIPSLRLDGESSIQPHKAHRGTPKFCFRSTA